MPPLTQDFWPLTSLQQLSRLRGFRPNDGGQGIGYEKGDRNAMGEQPAVFFDGEDESQPGAGFTLHEYYDAFCENEIRKIVASQARMSAESAAGRIGSVQIEQAVA